MKTVQPLSQNSSRLLHSSSIITSVFTVVKELVENSLDAGASNVEIKLENSGLDRIEVRDNGAGISKDSVPLLAKPHHTSKISTHSDLEDLDTYGFRGEALGAICAVGEMCITTKTADDNISTTYIFTRSGDISSSKPSAALLGTTVTVVDLFKNIPVRKKYYKSEKHKREEIKKIEDILCAFSFAQIGTRFALYHNNSLIWQKSSASELNSVIIQVFGNFVFSNMEHKFKECMQNLVRIEAFVPKRTALFSLSRTCNDRCVVLINKRPVHIKAFEKLLQELYCRFDDTSGARNRYPICLIDITLPPSRMDVNVEPNKSYVLVQDVENILNLLRDVLQEEGSSESVKSVPEEHSVCNKEQNEYMPVLENEKIRTKAACSIKKNATLDRQPSGNKEAIPDHTRKWIPSTVTDDNNTCVNKTPEKSLGSVASHADISELDSRNNTVSGIAAQSLLSGCTLVSKLVTESGSVSNFSHRKGMNFNPAFGEGMERNHMGPEQITISAQHTSHEMSELQYSNREERQDRFRTLFVEKNSVCDGRQQISVHLSSNKMCNGKLEHSSLDDSGGQSVVPEKDRSTVTSTASSMCMNKTVKPSVPSSLCEQISRGDDITEKQSNTVDCSDSHKESTDTHPKDSSTSNANVTHCTWSHGKITELSSDSVKPVAVLPANISKKRLPNSEQATEPKKKQKFELRIRPMTAFDYFCYDKRLEENSELSNQEVGRLLSEQWRLLSSDARSLYEKRALQQEQQNKAKKSFEAKKKVYTNVADAFKKQKRMCDSHKQHDATAKRQQLQIVSFCLEKVTSFLKSRKIRNNQNEVFHVAFAPISSVSSGIWLCQEKGRLVLLNTHRMRETLIYHRLMATFHLKAGMLDKPIPVTAELLGGTDTYHTFLMLCMAENGAFMMNEHISANGFNIKIVKSEQQVYAEVIGVTSVIPSYGVCDLSELLHLVKERGVSSPLSECRPLKVSIYLQGEAVRIARQSLPLQSKQELRNFLRESSAYLSPNVTSCFHNKPFKFQVFNMNTFVHM